MIEEYRSNNKIVYSTKYHVVFCPKYRRKVLEGAIGKRCARVFRKVARKYNAETQAMEISPDHVPLVVEVDPPFGIHRFVKYSKGISGHDLRNRVPKSGLLLAFAVDEPFVCSKVGGSTAIDFRERPPLRNSRVLHSKKLILTFALCSPILRSSLSLPLAFKIARAFGKTMEEGSVVKTVQPQ